MSQGPITIGGIPLPSDSPVFLSVLAVHVLAGLGSVTTGIIAMLSPKGPGRHPQFGTLYFRCLTVVFASMAILSAMRWVEDYHLFILGALSYTAAFLARRAVRSRSYWLLPPAVGIPLILRALSRHPLALAERRRA